MNCKESCRFFEATEDSITQSSCYSARAARQVLNEQDVAVRTLRSKDNLKSKFWETLLPDYVDPGLSDTAQQLIDALSVVPEGAQYWSIYEGVCRAFLAYLFVPDLGEPVS